MTGLPLLTRDQLDLVLLVCEYLRLCAVRGHPVGTSLAQLLEHEWRQGAQAQLLEPPIESEDPEGNPHVSPR